MAGYAAYSIVTPPFIGAFVNLLAPKKKKKPTDEDSYGITMLFEEGEDLADVKALATQLMTDKFGTDKSKWPKKFNKPWRDQGEKDKTNDDADGKTYGGFVAGRLFMNASTKQQPEVVDEALQPVISAKTVYSGCKFRASITLFWYDTDGNKGIGVSLGPVQKMDDGEPLGGGAPAAASVFSPVKTNKKKAAAANFDAGDDDEDPMA
jgi:hypothetical protein